MKGIEYEQKLHHCASELDDALHGNGRVTQYAINVIHDNSDKDVKYICSAIKMASSNGNQSVILKAIALKDALVSLCGYRQLSLICNSKQDEDDEEGSKTLEQLLDELNNLVGLAKVKTKVNDLIAYQKVQLLRKRAGLSVPTNTLHLAFTGNPGTGKTTIARIVGRIYKQLGLLSKGHFMEVSRTDLIAGYQGQTALKVKEVINKAKGGVLFIDEAYSITENDHSDSYGRECLTELTKALEDYRDDLVVIVAGYTEPMRKFFDSNPGLKSRFNTFITFEDYNAKELMDIICYMCEKDDYVLSNKAQELLFHAFVQTTSSLGKEFANGRFVRNIFEEMTMNHARRIVQVASPSLQDLKELSETDIPTDMLQANYLS